MAKEAYFRHEVLFRVVSRGDYTGYIENLVESIDLEIFVVNREGIITVWNRKLEERLGKKEKAIGRPLLKVLHSGAGKDGGLDWDRVIMREVIEKGKTVDIFRLPWRVGNEATRLFDIRTFPLKDRRGLILGGVAVITDITERARMENEQAISSRSSSVAHLGASVAHEIRNPLNSISLNIQILKEALLGKAKASKEEMIRGLDMISEEMERLNRIIRDFLDYSKPPGLRRKLGNPNEAITSAVELVLEEARQKGVEIARRLEAQEEILYDRDRMVQVIYNLLLNGIQASPVGGTIAVESQATRDYILIQVSDEGKGIPQEIRSKIFALFYTTREGGTGLGLSIANKIVEEHGGKMSVESREGAGTTFSIYLPKR